MADIRVGKAAFIEVGKRLRALPRPQCGVKKTRRRDVGLVDALALVRADGVCPRRALRQRQMRALRQQLDGLRKVQPLHLHHELYDRAALVTAEAVEELRFRIHGKGWCFFIVERTQAQLRRPLRLSGTYSETISSMLTRERNSSSHASENLPAMRTPRNHFRPCRRLAAFCYVFMIRRLRGGFLPGVRHFAAFYLPAARSLHKKYIPRARKKTFALF